MLKFKSERSSKTGLTKVRMVYDDRYAKDEEWVNRLYKHLIIFMKMEARLKEEERYQIRKAKRQTKV